MFPQLPPDPPPRPGPAQGRVLVARCVGVSLLQRGAGQGRQQCGGEAQTAAEGALLPAQAWWLRDLSLYSWDRNAVFT